MTRHLLARLEVTDVHDIACFAFLTLTEASIAEASLAYATLHALVRSTSGNASLSHRGNCHADLLSGLPEGFDEHGLPPELMMADGYMLLPQDFPADDFAAAFKQQNLEIDTEAGGFHFHSMEEIRFSCAFDYEPIESYDILPALRECFPDRFTPSTSTLLPPEDPMAVLIRMEKAYGKLHDQLSGLIESGSVELPPELVNHLAGPCLEANLHAGSVIGLTFHTPV